MQIRKAGAPDLGAVEAIVESAYGVYVERIGMRPGPMDADYAERIGRGLVWVADDEGVAGLIVLVEERDGLLIENVAVAPARQGEGIGLALLAHAEDEARRAGLAAMRLFTHEKMTENQALYARLGYRETERRPQPPGFALVYMGKELSGAS